MIKELIDAISLAITKEFAVEGYEVYTGTVEQGLELPCFFIRLINPDEEKEIFNRYKRTNQFAIQYHPKSGREEYAVIIERLYSCLENIKSLEGTTFEALRMRAEAQSDQVLTFLVNYDFYVYKTESIEDPMENIEINQTARS